MFSGILKSAQQLISNNSATFCNSHNFLPTAYVKYVIVNRFFHKKPNCYPIVLKLLKYCCRIACSASRVADIAVFIHQFVVIEAPFGTFAESYEFFNYGFHQF